MRSKKSQTVLARLKQITGTKSDASLSSALKVSPQTLSSWKGRDSTPYSLCVEIAQARGISLDWLLLGEGPVLRLSTAGNASEQTQETITRENTILAMWRLLNEEDRNAIQHALEEKRRLREMELKLSEMASILSTLQQLRET
ncbi:bacteriophage CI repressor [Pseudomonas umsongensis]|uniref:Transcriptional regulator n=1 Tax=Pseudomonas umsongensis TaxID=198618 RepID=A0ABX4DWK6_9PSED|nr:MULTISPECIES: helix-turn-helix domain-containing protein [Pseudomonas]OXR33081.1 transcriptional regulator [Pseudomonas umsongensis]QFG28450.1 bacteriophage CI repressor [Pseudomonas umsongensis]SDS35775.1 Bacteriophage CI repressor helix-turn-helix domain-containing protein [Pseudomonas umsongensis]